ncbi:MAG: hypothetical protein J6J13_05690 [Clostridia bacterium]|nr:hypothetical protein [Clostridia bacterium]
MSSRLKLIKQKLKNPKTLMLIGIIGIALIAVSSFLPKKAQVEKQSETSLDMDTYMKELETAVSDIVYGVTGDKKATVVITLESGIRYSYADINETDTSNSTGEKSEQTSAKKSQSYITVRTSDGGEEALLLTEIMPEIRGVAIICKGGDNEIVAEKIKNAVKAALDITSQRVYIAGGN